MPSARKSGGYLSRRQGAGGVEQRSELRSRPPWWDRLEARITISLVTIGILCVGASSYLVALTVEYYGQVGAQQEALQVEALALAEPYYEELARAQREAFVARTELLPHELHDVAFASLEPFLDRWVRSRENVVEVVVERPGSESVVVGRPDPESFLDPRARRDLSSWIHVPIESPLIGFAGEGSAVEPVEDAAAGVVRVTWAVDPAVQIRHQRLGELGQSLGTLEVASASGEDRTAERDEVTEAVITALSLASSLVLFVAIVAGILIARRTTRRVSDLSEVMRRVASGDLSVRAPRLGGDELGLLASAFNTMLDELEDSRRRIAYLQRVGAWQEMARRIAHEIKNPLTPIQLAVQQLREKDPGGDERFSRLLRDSVEIVEDEVESLRRMVTSFSQFAKVPEVALESVELDRILIEFGRAYSHIEAELEINEVPADPRSLGAPGSSGSAGSSDGRGDEPLCVLGDRQLLKQVLVNLAENAALSAAEAGVEAPRIVVSAALLDTPPRARITVEDNGPGIPPQRRELVFEPYETTRAHGTGLGLAIVKKIMLDHGGEVRVESSEALGGACFELRLRLAPETRAESERA